MGLNVFTLSDVGFFNNLTDGYVIPVEVKATTNLQAKSLKVYREKFKPEISIRTSLADFEINNGLYNIPLFMAGKFDEILKWK